MSIIRQSGLPRVLFARRLDGADPEEAGGEAGLRRKAAIPGMPLDFLRFVHEVPSVRFRDDRDDSGHGRPDSPTSDEAPPAAGERVRSLREDGGADGGATAPGWRPAAGTFSGWPEHLGALKILDPCCGSGHFLVAAFLMLVPMRMAREGLAPRDAVDAVLRDNLYGLELDPRCVELAAFALALAAWTYPGAEGYRPLPELDVACSGLAPNATKEQWTALAELAASAGGIRLGAGHQRRRPPQPPPLPGRPPTSPAAGRAPVYCAPNRTSTGAKTAAGSRAASRSGSRGSGVTGSSRESG